MREKGWGSGGDCCAHWCARGGTTSKWLVSRTLLAAPSPRRAARPFTIANNLKGQIVKYRLQGRFEGS